jgi:superfamily II DNA or RNA helicase
MIVNHILTVERDELTQKQWRKLFNRLTFTDAEENEWRFFRWRKQRGVVELPRGAWSMPEFDNVEYQDKRSCPKMPELEYVLELDNTDKDRGGSMNWAGQSDAVEAMLEQEQGIVVRMPGSGKSQIVLAFVAKCKTRALVIVHTHDLMKQWVQYAERAIPGIDVGVIQGRNYRIGQLTIATVQTLREYVDYENPKWWEQFGATIVDETHHAPAASWEVILNASTSRYRLGVTATEKRADKLDPVINYLIGPVIHRGDFTPELPTEVVPVKTGYYYPMRGRWDWSKMVRDLVNDDKRNALIAKKADEQVRKGHTVLILSRSIAQLENVQALMKTDRNAILAASGKSGVKGAARQQLVKNFRSGKLRCALATQLADEGLDVRRIGRLHLIHPGKFEGRIRQQVGRGLRTHADKYDFKILDYVDDRIPTLRRQWMERKRAYKTMKIPVKKMANERMEYLKRKSKLTVKRSRRAHVET